MKPPFDLAIVGGGITGVMAAFVAHRRDPQARIVLLDRAEIAAGASRYSAGLEIPFGRAPSQKAMAVQSAAFYVDLLQRRPGLAIRELASFLVFAPEHTQMLAGRFALELAPALTSGELEELIAKLPPFRLQPAETVTTGPWSRVADVAPLCRMLAHDLAGSQAVVFRQQAEVRGLQGDDIDGFRLQLIDGEQVHARRALSATGPWMQPAGCREFLLASGVRVKKIVAVHIAGAPLNRSPVLFFPAEDAFLLPLPGHWLLSIASGEWDCRPDPAQLHISPADLDLARSILNRRLPGLAQRITGGRVYCDAYALDWLPLISRLPGCTRFVVASGGSGAGYRLAPAIAERALDLLGWPTANFYDEHFNNEHREDTYLFPAAHA